MKIAVIGCGWLGLPLAKELVKNNNFVFGSTTTINKFLELETSSIHPFEYDGIVNKLIPVAIKESDCIIINFPPSKSHDYPAQIEELIRQFSDNCKIIFTSSTSVYQEIVTTVTENGLCKEDHKVFLAEEKIRNSNKTFTILRLAGLIGPNRHPIKFLTGKIIDHGNMVVNLVHQHDVIAAILKVLEQNAWNKTYNICWNEHPKKAKYYLNAAEKVGIKPPVFKNSNLQGKTINGNLIVHELDFQYKHSI
ncbi:MAG: hypothetical protein RI883_2309 [Bacteroidota bacterium]|jgi:nucleoside-diphosphate-sugar epimerase